MHLARVELGLMPLPALISTYDLSCCHRRMLVSRSWKMHENSTQSDMLDVRGPQQTPARHSHQEEWRMQGSAVGGEYRGRRSSHSTAETENEIPLGLNLA